MILSDKEIEFLQEAIKINFVKKINRIWFAGEKQIDRKNIGRLIRAGYLIIKSKGKDAKLVASEQTKQFFKPFKLPQVNTVIDFRDLS